MSSDTPLIPFTRDQYTSLHVQADKLIITDQPARTVKGLRSFKCRHSPIAATATSTGEFDYREYLARQDVYSTPHLRWAQVSCRARA